MTTISRQYLDGASVHIDLQVGDPIEVVIETQTRYTGKYVGAWVSPTGQVMAVIEHYVPLPLGSTGVFAGHSIVDLSVVESLGPRRVGHTDR